MFKRLLKDTVVYALSATVMGSLNIMLLPFLARQFTPQTYGVMDLLLTTAAMLDIIVPLSISQALARYYPDANPALRYQYASTGLWFTCCMYGLVLCFASLALHPIATLLIGDQDYALTLLIALISLFTYGIFNYLQIQLRWMLKPIYYTIASSVFILTNVSLTFLLVAYFNFSINGFFIARIVASIAGGLIAFLFSKNVYRFYFAARVLKIMLAFSSPLTIASLSTFFSVYADRFIIRGNLSLTDLGIYSVCAKLASIAGSMITLLNFALTPLIYANYKNPATRIQLAFLFKLVIYVMLATVIALLLFSKPLLILIAGEAYSAGHYLLPLLAASFIITGLYNCAPGLWIANKTRLIAKINAVSALFNICLCFALIPHWGILGAGMATLTSSIFLLVASTKYAQKYYYISYDWPKIGYALGLATVLGYFIIRN